MRITALCIPEAMLQSLLQGDEMSITTDDEINSKEGDTIDISSDSSATKCKVGIVRFVRGPAVEVFQTVKDEPAQSGSSVSDAIAGLEQIGRPPTTIITFMRVRAILSLN